MSSGQFATSLALFAELHIVDIEYSTRDTEVDLVTPFCLGKMLTNSVSNKFLFTMDGAPEIQISHQLYACGKG